jgi:hypothetical protein
MRLERELLLRITIVDPPPGVTFCVQRGDTELVAPAMAAESPLSFDFTVSVREDASVDGPRLMGPFVKGPWNARFVYLNSGTLAGQAGSPWNRRAKVPLTGINAELIEKAIAAPGGLLEAQIGGTAADGGPACATVALLGRGWSARLPKGKQAPKPVAKPAAKAATKAARDGRR